MLTRTRSTPPDEIILSESGADIFVRVWRPQAPARAVLAICHGVNSHGGQYAWVAEQMVAEGLAVYALDLRGRGRSSGERFFVEKIDDYVADLHAMIQTLDKRVRDAERTASGGDQSPTREDEIPPHNAF